MIETVFQYLTYLDGIFWSYCAFLLIMVLGFYLTFKNKFFQIRQISNIAKTFFHFLRQPHETRRGLHPISVFFASTGGMIGIGNIVGIATAIQMGGPGALFWVWMAGLIGAIIKYGEIYLGIKYRVENAQGGYDGGPMYFLKAAFKNKFIPLFVAGLLCIYGVEIYQFTVITESVSTNWHLNHFLVVGVLLVLILYAGLGGVKRTGQICSWLMPVFMATYLGMSIWIIGHEIGTLPAILSNVFAAAFKGQAAVGGFAGATVVLAIQHGIARAAYSGDIGIGYDSIIQSESSTVHPEKQARLAILGVFLDNFICTLSILLVLVSGVWKAASPVDGSRLVQNALGMYFPYMEIFMPIFLVICGYTTLIAFFCVGLKSAHYLWPVKGRKIYTLYAIFALIFFTFFDQKNALVIMSIAGSLLLITNLLGIFRLRKEILFVDSSEVVDSQVLETN